jgi:hypothetical protein
MGLWDQGVVLSRTLSCIRAATVLSAVAMVVGGCAGAGNNTASTQSEQPYKTMYGISSEGTTTDLYTELFGPRKPVTPPETATAAVQPVQQPTTASPANPAVQPPPPVAATQPAQVSTSATTRQSKSATTSTAGRQVQPAPAPAPAPVAVAQQAPAPQAEPEPDVPVGYGITANGPTTDLYTVLFGPRSRDSQ